MKMQRMFHLLAIAVSFLAVSAVLAEPAMQQNPPSNNSVQTEHKKEKSTWKRIKKALIKSRLIQKTVVPCLMKIEQIKDEGISRTDVAKLLVFASSAYLVASYVRSLYKYTPSETYRALSSNPAMLGAYSDSYGQKKSSNNLSKLSVAAGIAGACYLMYSAEQVKRKFNTFSHLLISSFTPHQKAAIEESAELSELVERAHEDPHALHNHSHFVSLLTPEQKSHLASAIEEDSLPIEFILDEPSTATPS